MVVKDRLMMYFDLFYDVFFFPGLEVKIRQEHTSMLQYHLILSYTHLSTNCFILVVMFKDSLIMYFDVFHDVISAGLEVKIEQAAFTHVLGPSS